MSKKSSTFARKSEADGKGKHNTYRFKTMRKSILLAAITLQGTVAQTGHKGIVIQNGKKIIK
ncbi:MAG: hypothetical protein IJQ20_04700 [Paludibacteraceae bacterium]|nr:hypothetical protein [Paludibacteraceae bacterium]MBQ6984210.1 hypothetical protein [Paludibacteraceae bacterium]